MKKFFLFFPLFLLSLESQPWFGDVYQFHLLSRYSYSRFNQFQNGRPQLEDTFQANVLYLGLDFSPTPVWSVDTDLQVADTSAMSFNFRSFAVQGRYLWYDDIVGDPVSFATGASMRITGTHALRDISCPSHGNVDFELNFSLGKEFEASNQTLLRTWAYGAIGHANRGAPWVRGILAFEANVDDQHKWAIYAEAVNGYGRHSHVDLNHFYGYARIREKAVDFGVRYGKRLDVWGTLRFEYIRRVLAKSSPEDVNTFRVSYLLPFSF